MIPSNNHHGTALSTFAIALLALMSLILSPTEARAQQLAVTSFKRMETDLDARVNHPLKDQNGKVCAIIKVENKNTGFAFDTGTLMVQKVEQQVGEIWVYVMPGVKKMTIRHQELGILREYRFPMEIEAATVYVMKLESGNVQTIVTPMAQQSGYLIVESEPTGAQVWLNEELAGVTPFNQKYPLGTELQYRIRKSLYHDYIGMATIDKTQTRVQANLKPAFGSLQITSNPDGAMVFLDDEAESVGKTPLTLNQVASGSHIIRLQKAMYGMAQQSVTVADGQKATANISLAARFANITIQTLPNATIEVDGRNVGTGKATVQQGEGICDIKVSLKGHRDMQRQIEVKAGIDQTLQLEPTPIYGSLAVESTPMEADIIIDGKNYGQTPNIIPYLLIGDYTVKLSKQGFADHTSKVVIRENQETVYSTTLENKIVNNNTANTNLQTISNVKEFTVNRVTFKMVEVEGGTFTMGATAEQGSDAFDSEKPAHQVTLSSYKIGQTEVTQALWQAVMGSNPSKFKGENRPVENVSWNDCQEFIRKLNAATGQNFRLPTEAEWEYAARGGNKSKGYKYSGSNTISDVAWYMVNCYDKGQSSPEYRTHDVATKQANELGIYDMSGNVWEWCSDWYGSYSSGSQTNPTGASSGSYRVGRGGRWSNGAGLCRVSNRGNDSPGFSSSNLGLRLAL